MAPPTRGLWQVGNSSMAAGSLRAAPPVKKVAMKSPNLRAGVLQQVFLKTVEF
jgi:hypothetical protein